jgi:hypothetical protein
MPIRPEDLYAAARQLDQINPTLVSDEVCGRTIANRAYYAAFLATRDALRAQYGDPRFDVQHTRLARALEKSGAPLVSGLGTLLRFLKLQREKADYRPHAAFDSQFLVPLVLSRAKEILEMLPRATGSFPVIVS